MTRFRQHKELPIKYIQHKLKEFFNEDDIDNNDRICNYDVRILKHDEHAEQIIP